MAFVKATFQKTVRRFPVPDDFTYEPLRKKLVDMFPELEGTAPESLMLYYRDTDNDLVIISSDEELHTAQQHMAGDNGTLKLLIAVKPPEAKMETAQKESDEDDAEDLMEDLVHELLLGGSTPFNHHYHHRPSSIFGHNPFGNSIMFDLTPSWSDRRRLLQQQEERVRRQREYEERLRKAHQEHVKEMRERAKKAQEKRKQEEKKTSNAGSDVAVKEGSGNKPAIPNFPPGWVVNPYGSWEPAVYHHPSGGTTHVWGPWGYTATYGEKDTPKKEEDEEHKEEQGQPKEEQPKEEQPKAEGAETKGEQQPMES